MITDGYPQWLQSEAQVKNFFRLLRIFGKVGIDQWSADQRQGYIHDLLPKIAGDVVCGDHS